MQNDRIFNYRIFLPVWKIMQNTWPKNWKTLEESAHAFLILVRGKRYFGSLPDKRNKIKDVGFLSTSINTKWIYTIK